jgi:cobyrinic acid a,c-diamide synthase
VAAFAAAGGAIYAECGGLMYLCSHLRWGQERRAMAGVLDAEVEMRERPQGRGLVRLRETQAFPWPAPAVEGEGAGAGGVSGDPGARPREVAGHEFHHSAIIRPDPGWTYAYEVLRGTGIDGRHDGVVHRNVLACYCHLRDIDSGWTARFLAQVRRARAR